MIFSLILVMKLALPSNFERIKTPTSMDEQTMRPKTSVPCPIIIDCKVLNLPKTFSESHS
jgi:hypothetical protein